MLGDGIMPVNMPEFRYKVKTYRFMPEIRKSLGHLREEAFRAGKMFASLPERWNIGIIGMGKLGCSSLVEIARLKNPKNPSLMSGLGKFFLATSNPGKARAAVRSAHTSSEGSIDAEVLPLQWDALDRDPSRRSIETIVENAHICVIAGEDTAAYLRLCEKLGYDPEKPKDRNVQTRANFPWINLIAPVFEGFKGLGVMASNLSDSLGYGFALRSRLDPTQVVALNYIDTMRLKGDVKAIKQILLDDGFGLKYPRLMEEGSEDLIFAYSVGSHNDPYCIIYFDGKRIDKEMVELSRKRLNKAIKGWGQEQVKAGGRGATAGETGVAVARTLESIMDGGEPVCCSVFFDSPVEGEQCYFGLPVVFKPVEGKTTPRPRVIEDQVRELFGEDGFVERLQAQRAEIRELRKEGLIEGTIVVGPPPQRILDLGYLYVSGSEGEKRGVKEFRVSNDKGEDLHHLNFLSSDKVPDIRGLAAIDDKYVYCWSGVQSATNPKNCIHVLENMKVVNSIGPINAPLKGVKAMGGKLYIGVGQRQGDKIIILDAEKRCPPDELAGMIAEAPDLGFKLKSFDVMKTGEGHVVYACSSMGDIYLLDGSLARVSEEPFSQAAPTAKSIFGLEGTNLVLAYNSQSVSFVGTGGRKRRIEVKPKLFATDMHEGRLRALKGSDQGLELRAYDNPDDVLKPENEGELCCANREIDLTYLRSVGLHPKNRLHEGIVLAYLGDNSIQAYDDRRMQPVGTFQFENVNFGKIVLWGGK